MELVQFLVAIRMLKLPHPLLSYDADFIGICRRDMHVKVNHRSPTENCNERSKGHKSPRPFNQMLVGLFDSTAVARTPSISDAENEYQSKDDSDDDPAQEK